VPLTVDPEIVGSHGRNVIELKPNCEWILPPICYWFTRFERLDSR
jgi:hypothetical protein